MRVSLTDSVAAILNLDNYAVVKDARCLILETQNHFIRVQIRDLNDPCVGFEQVLANAYAEEFRSFGIDSEFIFEIQNDEILLIEKTQKLQILKPEDMSLGEAKRRASFVTKNVEMRLGFPELVAQCKQNLGIEQVERIRIARDAPLKFSGFANFEGKVIPVNNTRQFLAIMDASGRWNSGVLSDCFQVDTNFGKFVFAPKKFPQSDDEFSLRLFESTSQWWLFPSEVGEEYVNKRAIAEDDLSQMNEANLKILNDQKKCPVKAISFTVEEEQNVCA